MSKKKQRAAGRTAPAVVEGEVWAVPVPGAGYCPLLITRAPLAGAEVDFVFAYLRPTLHKRLPTPGSLGVLAEWEQVWLGLVATVPFKKGRWKRCGVLPVFDRADWPIPPARNSLVDESEPVEKWGEKPWAELWSIETTADEPTMTLIANTPATREQALRFPRIHVVTGANRVESALSKHFKGKRAGFWDMELQLNAVGPESARMWREHADRVRVESLPPPTSWLPAGRRTDRQLRAGAWLGLPLTGGGFGAAMLVEKPPRGLRFFSDAVVMTMRRQWDRWPTMDDVRTLRPEDGAEVSQTTMICVRDGRWRVLGYQDGFETGGWTWPKPVQVPINPSIQRLDPESHRRCNGMSSPSSMESDVLRIMNGTHYSLTGTSSFPDGIVTPDRIAAWRAINMAAEKYPGV